MKKIYLLAAFILSGQFLFGALSSEKLSSLINEANQIVLNSESAEQQVFTDNLEVIKNTNITSSQQLSETEDFL